MYEHLQSGDGKTARDAGCGAGEAAQQLKALGALAEEPRLISIIHTVAHNHSFLTPDPIPSSDFFGHQHARGVHTYMQAKKHKINLREGDHGR